MGMFVLIYKNRGDVIFFFLMASRHLSARAVMDRHTVLSLMQLLSSSAGMSVSFLNKSM